MRVLSDALTEKDELHQTIKYYEDLLTEELVVPSHLYNAMKIKELREKIWRNSFNKSTRAFY